MVIVYTYLKGPQFNTFACIPFRYNIEDEEKVESREVVLEVDPAITNIEGIKQKLLEMLDKEKMDNGKADEFTSDMSGVVTIE